MSLQCPKEHNNDCQDLHASTKLLLEPKSLLILARDARFKWRHGISRGAKHIHLKDGTSISRVDPNRPPYRRISLTIRHLKSTRRKVVDFDLGLTTLQAAFKTCTRYIDEACSHYNISLNQKGRLLKELQVYGNSGRLFHTWCYLVDLFTLLDSYRAFFSDRPAVILAILFHNVVYNTKSSTNQEDSALVFKTYADICRNDQLNLVIKEKVAFYVMSIKDYQMNNNLDKDLILLKDMCVAVFGWPRERYKRYLSHIRIEHSHLSDDQYRSYRLKELYLMRDSNRKIYSSAEFKENEESAKQNINWEIKELSV